MLRVLALSFAFMLVTLAPPVSAAISEQDKADIVTDLELFLAGASINDPTAHENFWAEELTYTSSGGLRFGKDQLMAGMRDAEQPEEGGAIIWYRAADIEIKPLADAVIVNFTLLAEADHDPDAPTQKYLNTGVLVKRDGRWQAINWNATKASEASEAAEAAE